jgi:hypothetical protein
LNKRTSQGVIFFLPKFGGGGRASSGGGRPQLGRYSAGWLNYLREPGQSYSDVIPTLATAERGDEKSTRLR